GDVAHLGADGVGALQRQVHAGVLLGAVDVGHGAVLGAAAVADAHEVAGVQAVRRQRVQERWVDGAAGAFLGGAQEQGGGRIGGLGIVEEQAAVGARRLLGGDAGDVGALAAVGEQPL